MVDNIAYHDSAQWGGAYSDSLIVEVPDDTESRSRIIALCNQHSMAQRHHASQLTTTLAFAPHHAKSRLNVP